MHSSGLYSCKMDSIQPYCLDFNIKTQDIKEHRKVHLFCKVNISEDPKALFITDIQSKGERVFWESNPLHIPSVQPGVWQNVEIEINLPAMLPVDGVLFLYFWNVEMKNTATYFDDVLICISD